MVKQFTIKPLPSIYFAVGSIEQLASLANSYGKRLLVLTGNSLINQENVWEKITASLQQNSSNVFFSTVGTEPSPEMIDTIVQNHYPEEIDTVIAIGGGSVLDAGKAVSAMLPGGNSVQEFLEGVGSKNPDGQKIPYIAVPTTAGTGSEATNNAVITRTGDGGFKKSLRHDNYVPDAALIDPALMRTCPQDITAACGMDTLTQLVEGFLSTKASEMTDALAWSGIKAVQRSLISAFQNGDDLQARSDMAYGSLCSGIVLTNSGLGVIHGMAPVLGSLFNVPHGVVCGTLMAAANEASLNHLLERRNDCESLVKYARLGQLFSTKEDGSAEFYQQAFIEQLYRLTEALNLPLLADFGITDRDIVTIISQSETKNNPAALTDAEMAALLKKRI
jgi:alcohol dehydrogenase